MLTRERTVDVEELEALWEASPSLPDDEAVGPRKSSRLRATRSVASRISGPWLALAWVLFIVGAIVFEPAPSPEAVTPLWGTLVVGGFFVALVTAGLVGSASPRLGFGAATVAGVFGIAVSVGCQTTGHHLGSWWLVELGATTALTGVGAAGLAGRLRRR